MLPLYDREKPDQVAYATWFVIVANLGVWLFLQGAGFHVDSFLYSICNFSFVPAALTHQTSIESWQQCQNYPHFPVLGIFTSMFVHGSWGHIVGNLWFLHIFGDNVEDRWGHFRFFFFYILSGLGGALLQYSLDPLNPVPMVGASGAISGVAGAYLVMHPQHRVVTLIPLGFYIRTYELRAWIVLAYWIGLQLLGVMQPAFGGSAAQGGGVAYGAHIGGVLVGVFLAMIFGRTRKKSYEF